MGILTPSRVFLLSPARCGGPRTTMLLAPKASFALARALASRDGAPLGEVFAFLSGLYFRGKLAYARRFAEPITSGSGGRASSAYVITPSRGLVEPDARVRRATLEQFSHTSIALDNARYRRPLERSCRALAETLRSNSEVVLLGSIATTKYIDVLLAIFGSRLMFPVDFVGRGDMSRGGLLLRKVQEGVELEYAPVAGAILHGARPAKLPPLKPRPEPVQISSVGRP